MVEHASGRRKRRFRKMQKIYLEGGLGRIDELRLKKGMDQRIRELYLAVRREEDSGAAVSEEFQEEIVEMLREAMDGKEQIGFVQIRDVAFMAASAGEENGFVKGFKYAFHLFAECIW